MIRIEILCDRSQGLLGLSLKLYTKKVLKKDGKVLCNCCSNSKKRTIQSYAMQKNELECKLMK